MYSMVFTSDSRHKDSFRHLKVLSHKAKAEFLLSFLLRGSWQLGTTRQTKNTSKTNSFGTEPEPEEAAGQVQLSTHVSEPALP